MSLSNKEKQKRHRKYKKMAIRWYESATGFSIKEIMDNMKLADYCNIKGVERYREDEKK